LCEPECLHMGALKPKVLIIDDDQSMLELLRLQLSNAGYEVLMAQDAMVGGRLALSAAPDLMIVDVKMPYMDGYEFVAAAKSDSGTRNIPVIFLTSVDDIADRAAELGAAAYLTKPVLADRLLEIVALFAAKPAP